MGENTLRPQLQWNTQTATSSIISIMQEAELQAMGLVMSKLESTGIVVRDQDTARIVATPVDLPLTNAGAGRSLGSREAYKKFPVEECPSEKHQLVRTKEGFLDFCSMMEIKLPQQSGPNSLSTYSQTGLPNKFLDYFVASDAEFEGDLVVVLQFYVFGRAYLLDLRAIAQAKYKDDALRVGIAKVLKVCLVLCVWHGN